jgi:hypothetical protein
MEKENIAKNSSQLSKNDGDRTQLRIANVVKNTLSEADQQSCQCPSLLFVKALFRLISAIATRQL